MNRILVKLQLILLTIFSLSSQIYTIDDVNVAKFSCKVRSNYYLFNITAPLSYCCNFTSSSSLELFSRDIDQLTPWVKFTECKHGANSIECYTYWKVTEMFTLNTIQFRLEITTNNTKHTNITSFFNTGNNKSLAEWTTNEEAFYCFKNHGIENLHTYPAEKEIQTHFSTYKHDKRYKQSVIKIQINTRTFQKILATEICNYEDCAYKIGGLTPCTEYKICFTIAYKSNNVISMKCTQVKTICSSTPIQLKEVIIIVLVIVLVTIVLLGIVYIYRCRKTQRQYNTLRNNEQNHHYEPPPNELPSLPCPPLPPPRNRLQQNQNLHQSYDGPLTLTPLPSDIEPNLLEIPTNSNSQEIFSVHNNNQDSLQNYDDII